LYGAPATVYCDSVTLIFASIIIIIIIIIIIHMELLLLLTLPLVYIHAWLGDSG